MTNPEIGRAVSLSLSSQRLEKRGKGSAFQLLPSLRSCVGAQVALQRGPILRTSMSSLPCPFIHPLQRGHLYFAE